MKTLENYSIHDIEAMTEESAFIYAEDTAIIKEHDIYFVDFGGYFGFSALVFYDAKHIYYANDYQLHHKKITWHEDGTSTSEDYTKKELKDLYIKALNNKLFTDEELSEPLKSYDEYQKKAHIKEIESIQAKATKGHITLNEYMQILVDAERYINQYNRYN